MLLKWLFIWSLTLGVGAGLSSACQPSEEPVADLPAREPRTLAHASAELATLDPSRAMSAILDLIELINQAEAKNDADAANQAKGLLLRASLDVWAYASAAHALALVADDPSIAAQWAEEQARWTETLTAVRFARSGLTADNIPVGNHDAAIAAALRPIARTLSHTPEHRALALEAMVVLNAVRTELNSPSDIAGQALLLTDPSAVMSRPIATLVASRIVVAIASSRDIALDLRTRYLLRSMPHVCAASVLAQWEQDQSLAPLEELRRRCGFACTTSRALGQVGVPLPPLDPSVYETCARSELSLDNELTVRTLEALLALVQRFDATTTGGSGLQEQMEPLLELFAAQVQELVLPGSLPFLMPKGANGMTLASIDGQWGTVEPTRAVAVFDGNDVRIAAWPRFAVRDGAVVAIDADGFAFPGASVARADAITDESVQRTRAAMLGVYALAWPTQPTHEPITVVTDGSTPASELARGLSLLARAGVTEVRLAGWKSDETSWPTTRSQPVLLGPLPARSPRLRLADGGSALVDPLGRVTAIPMASLQRFLPDLYQRIVQYYGTHPGLNTLVVRPHEALDVKTLIMALIVLEFVREGDVMESTETLLRAPRALTSLGPLRVLDAIYLDVELDVEPDIAPDIP